VCKNDPKGPAHTALSVREFLASKQITMLEHPPYSLDLAPSDFLLFLKIKARKGKHFDDIDDIRSNTTAALKAIPQNQFQNCLKGGGLGTGIGSYLPHGSTLKATTVIFRSEVCSTITVMSSWTLLSDHVLFM
jgi:hypothetical protein